MEGVATDWGKGRPLLFEEMANRMPAAWCTMICIGPLFLSGAGVTLPHGIWPYQTPPVYDSIPLRSELVRHGSPPVMATLRDAPRSFPANWGGEDASYQPSMHAEQIVGVSLQSMTCRRNPRNETQCLQTQTPLVQVCIEMIVFPDPGKKGGDKGHRFLGLIINTVLSSTDLPSQIIDHVLYIKELGYSFSYTVGSKKARWLGCGEKCPTNVWLKLDKYLSSTAQHAARLRPPIIYHI